MKKVLAFVLAVMMLIPAFAGIGSFAAETPTVEIVSNNVWYGETLNLMYAVKVENADGYEIKLDVTKDGEPVSVYDNGEETVKGELCRVFIVEKGVAAQDIDAEYIASVSLVKGEEEIKGNTTKYSVLEYLNERLYVSEGVTAEQKNVYTTLLDYAKKADKVLNKDNSIADLVYVNIEGGEVGMCAVGKTVTATVQGREPSDGMAFCWEIAYADGRKSIKTLEEMEAGIQAEQTMVITLGEIPAGGDDVLLTATITLDSTSKRTAFSTSQQVWEENGIVFTNDKASSTNDVANYANPARVYANSKITVEHLTSKISKIVFDCNSSSYANALKDSIGTVSGATVTVSSDKVTVTFTTPVESFVVEKLTAQVRLDGITING